MSSADVCRGGMELPKVVGCHFPAKPTLLSIRRSVFCSGEAAVHSNVIKIKIIDCLCLYLEWYFITLTLNTRRKCRG